MSRNSNTLTIFLGICVFVIPIILYIIKDKFNKMVDDISAKKADIIYRNEKSKLLFEIEKQKQIAKKEIELQRDTTNATLDRRQAQLYEETKQLEYKYEAVKKMLKFKINFLRKKLSVFHGLLNNMLNTQQEYMRKQKITYYTKKIQHVQQRKQLKNCANVQRMLNGELLFMKDL